MYPGEELFTPKIMIQKILGYRRWPFLNWTYASEYEDYLICFAPNKDEAKKRIPLKAWKRIDDKALEDYLKEGRKKL